MFLLVDQVSPGRSSGRWGGEPAEEESRVGGPYESFGDFGVAFRVDPESAVIDKPCPGPFDNPAAWQNLKAGALDAVDDLNVDVMCVVTVIDEYLLETSIDPEFGQPTRLPCCIVNDADPAEVVDHAGRHHGDGQQEAEGVDQAEHLPARDLLPSVKSSCRAGHGRGARDAAGIHDPARRVAVAP